MNQLLPLLFQLGLLNLAGIFILILMRLQADRQTRRILETVSAEPADLTPLFADLQERIASEAQETRKQALSHAGNNQTAVKLLTDVTKRLPSLDQIKGVVESEAVVVANSVSSFVQDQIEKDGKLTRERIAQVKTRLADEERDDQESKSQQRRIAAMNQTEKPKKASK